VRSTLSMERLEAITGNASTPTTASPRCSGSAITFRGWRRRATSCRQRVRDPCADGEIAVDRSSAGNIGGVYDMAAGTWSAEMLDALGIPQSMMPPRLVASSDVVGKLSMGAASRLVSRRGPLWSPVASMPPSRPWPPVWHVPASTSDDRFEHVLGLHQFRRSTRVMAWSACRTSSVKRATGTCWRRHHGRCGR